MEDIKIVLGCQGMGDILCSIPAIKYMSRIYNQKIKVFTYNAEILKNFPFIELIDYIPNDAYHTFDIQKYLHHKTDIRQLHAISLGFQLSPNEMQIEFYPDKYTEIEYLPKEYIVIHPVKTWASRTWERERWQDLADKLSDIIPVIAIGKDSSEIGNYNTEKPSYKINIKNGIDLTNKTNIHQTWHILNNAILTVTMDSGILHLAGTTDTYIVQPASSIDHFYRAPYRYGSQNYKYSYVYGECKLFCASDLKYNIIHHGTHKILPPIPFCLERLETIGTKDEPNQNIYKCHPTVDSVYNEIISHIPRKKDNGYFFI